MRKRIRVRGPNPSIVITDIRDREDNALPARAMESVARQVLEAVADLGLKATVETSGGSRARPRASDLVRGVHPDGNSGRSCE
jgi:hypothetical protein